ncbi:MULTISPECIES: DUF29 domain-containing protein [unclassified Aureimonas]|uniref:DUF29 domain-containing protein n=1 Tax=unclassified Aureimonas TaxID=2615206 RepID=UPI0006F4A7A2|nr:MULTISPECIES: DUF29 domain-containing protein [unclassified Aureimonas]KQT52989.1 hypothetical protein ASG62_13875 [Aureimonas sp. Leaf427]KQT80446.1 hypothetical protein ASG54_07725 [Aureimonas sp. Leaf460]
MTPSQQHDTDFYRWTQDQAALLRALPLSSNRLDIENLAEEIEDMGRAEIREISSLLRQTLTHLVKIAFDHEAPSVAHWVGEASGFQGDAVLAYSPGLRQRLDLPKIWQLAKRNAADSLDEHGVAVPPLPEECPLTLDQLLAPDFSPRRAAATVASCASSDSADHG